VREVQAEDRQRRAGSHVHQLHVTGGAGELSLQVHPGERVIPQTKCKRKFARAPYTVHDGIYSGGVLTARCVATLLVRGQWHHLPGHTTTTCKRCIKLRKGN
jgi:hypothetical protein